MRPVDKLIAGYLLLVTLVILARGDVLALANAGMLIAHVLFGVLFYLFSQLSERDRIGRQIHDFYPLLFLIPFYTEFGLLNDQLALESILRHDTTVQAWESAIFGSQISYDLIREYPSVVASWILHLAYFGYYPIVVLGPAIFVVRGQSRKTQEIMLSMMMAFIICYVVFIFYPVAGPNWAFAHPTGAVRDVWTADLVYGILSQASSIGSAFPSSHVAATVATTLAVWRAQPSAGRWFAVPCGLLVIGTVYCQMHYGVDATTGVGVGVFGWWLGGRVLVRQPA
ncbi:MAG: phosphatase PAP2 family protein [Gemmatimonadales bacterium]